MGNMLDEQVAVSEIKGVITDLIEKLSGKDSKSWLIALKKFLRGENPWPEYKFQVWKRLVIPAGSSEESITKDFYSRTPWQGYGKPTLNFTQDYVDFDALSKKTRKRDGHYNLFELSVEMLGFECEPEEYDTQEGVELDDIVEAALKKGFVLLEEVYVYQLMMNIGRELKGVLIPISKSECKFIQQHENSSATSYGPEVPTMETYPQITFPMTAKFIFMKKR